MRELTMNEMEYVSGGVQNGAAFDPLPGVQPLAEITITGFRDSWTSFNNWIHDLNIHDAYASVDFLLRDILALAGAYAGPTGAVAGYALGTVIEMYPGIPGPTFEQTHGYGYVTGVMISLP